MSQDDKQFIEELVGKPQSDQEVFEAMSNLVGFFDLLYRVDKRLNEKNHEEHRRDTNNSSQTK